jgi:hypothetical protein
MNDISKKTKINRLINNWPKGTLKTVKELEDLGYKPELLQIYSKSNWLELFVRGMYKKHGDEVEWFGALHGFQTGSPRTSIHAGGKTVLSLKGYSHYIKHFENRVYLFSSRKETVPVWIKKFEQLMLIRSLVFDYSKDKYFMLFDTGNFEIKISCLELAAMEMLYLVPTEQTFDEAAKLMEGLYALRPQIVQSLLEDCSSVKVKRLFLFISEYHNHPWFKELNLHKVNLGSGKRLIVEGGVLNRKYEITVPKEYAGE